MSAGAKIPGIRGQQTDIDYEVRRDSPADTKRARVYGEKIKSLFPNERKPAIIRAPKCKMKPIAFRKAGSAHLTKNRAGADRGRTAGERDG